MDKVLTFIRDEIVGLPYVILVIVCLFFFFAIIGYLGSLKYSRSSQTEKI